MSDKNMGDIPNPTFGHTFTRVSDQYAILFGGAVADQGKFNIINLTYLFDQISKKWTKLSCKGIIPSQRAAHSSTNIEDLQMVVYGGAASGGGALCSDDLFLLNLKDSLSKPTWLQIQVQGQTPGKRYGHSLLYFKPYIICFGGNTGTIPVNDVWILNVDKAPYCWEKIICVGPNPSPRVYQDASLCNFGTACGMIVVYGGRGIDQTATNDTWGLRKHRVGRWDWVQAPYRQNGVTPIPRYQHSVNFAGSLLIVAGGRSNNTEEYNLPIEIYDTETSEWMRFDEVNRYRHASVLFETQLYFHGGFEPLQPNKPLDSLINFNLMESPMLSIILQKTFSAVKQNKDNLQDQQTKSFTDTLVGKKEQVKIPQKMQTQNTSKSTRERQPGNLTPLRTNTIKQQQLPKNIRLANKAVVATVDQPEDDDFNYLCRKIPLLNLQEEWKKVGMGFQDPNMVSPVNNYEGLFNKFIQEFLMSVDQFQAKDKFPFKSDLVARLCSEVLNVIDSQPILLKIRAPLKVFGDIHGQFSDLLRLFENFGVPNDENGIGDIEKFNYLFLGNYVDRGFNSLETICLMFALKLKYPDSIYLLRGQHEDRRVNRIYGFAEECAYRFNEDIDDPQSVYQKINQVFDYMPLAALVEDKILCINSGIGKSFRNLDQIEQIETPLNVFDDSKQYQHQLLLDLLWSEFSNNCDQYQLQKKDIFATKKLFTYDENNIEEFLLQNSLNLIIRSNYPSQEGYQIQCDGKLVSITSCTNFNGSQQNAAGLIKIQKNRKVTPNIINATTYKNQTWLKLDQNTYQNVQVDFNQEEIDIRKNISK